MSAWSYDVHADRNDRLVREWRIPVTSSHPGYAFLISFDRMSERRPTRTEADTLKHYVDHRRERYPLDTQLKMLERPLDNISGANTITFHKWVDGDWGYRRVTFHDGGPLFWPGREGDPTRKRSFTLLELLDEIESAGDHQFDDWVLFKQRHPKIFHNDVREA